MYSCTQCTILFLYIIGNTRKYIYINWYIYVNLDVLYISLRENIYDENGIAAHLQRILSKWSMAHEIICDWLDKSLWRAHVTQNLFHVADLKGIDIIMGKIYV